MLPQLATQIHSLMLRFWVKSFWCKVPAVDVRRFTLADAQGSRGMYLGMLLILTEVIVIASINYMTIKTYVSLDVLYCLPIVHAARLQSIHTQRKDDLLLPLLIGFLVGAIWSLLEALVTPDGFPVNALLLNIFSRGVTFTSLGTVVGRLWREREYGHKDFLTDLSNQQELLVRLAQVQSRSTRTEKPYSLLYLNISGLGEINNAQGHQSGDNALHKAAEIFSSFSRGVDTVARIGSAQFAMLLPETDEQVAEVVKKRILTSAAREFQDYGWNLSVSVRQITRIGQRGSFEELLNELLITPQQTAENPAPPVPVQD